MERITYKKLLEWKSKTNRKPLIVNGARQVGKTWLLKEFGKKEYKNIAYVSLDKKKEAADVFENDFDTDRIIRQLSAIIGIDIMPETTLNTTWLWQVRCLEFRCTKTIRFLSARSI